MMMNKKMADKVVEVERYSDRIMRVKLSIGKGIWNVISVYALQAGRSWEEKEKFVEDLEEMLRRVPENEFLVIGDELNAHLEENNKEYTEEHGNHGYGSRDDERDLWLEMMQANLFFAINTCFKKRSEHRISYKSGSNSTQVDYIKVRQQDMKRVKNAKVLP